MPTKRSRKTSKRIVVEPHKGDSRWTPNAAEGLLKVLPES